MCRALIPLPPQRCPRYSGWSSCVDDRHHDSDRPLRQPSLRLAEGMLLLTTFIWGGTFAATKVILEGGLGPMTLLSWRFGIAAILFLLFFIRRLIKGWTPRTLLVGIALGILLYLGFGTQTIGLGTTSSSRS